METVSSSETSVNFCIILHYITTQKAALFIVSAMRTPHPRAYQDTEVQQKGKERIHVKISSRFYED
jgi:hypothetical protein